MEVLYDGECPLCSREARFLERLDGGRGRLRMVDITESGFDASEYGATQDEVMGKIHARTPEGDVITGMGVFRRAYREVGWGWVVAPTGWPVLRPVFDAMYRWFARNRRWLTGQAKRDCDSGRCKV